MSRLLLNLVLWSVFALFLLPVGAAAALGAGIGPVELEVDAVIWLAGCAAVVVSWRRSTRQAKLVP